jgi:hypothetical protein
LTPQALVRFSFSTCSVTSLPAFPILHHAISFTHGSFVLISPVGVLDFDDFLALVSPMKPDDENDLKAAFAVLDWDRTGTISAENLAYVPISSYPTKGKTMKRETYTSG